MVLLAAIPTAALIFWRHTLAALSSLFGSTGILRRPIEVEGWMLLLCMLIPLVALGWVFVVQCRRIRKLEARVFIVATAVVNPIGVGMLERALERGRKP